MDQIVACYKDMWVNWNNFSGRTRRSGYWYVILANFLVSLALSIIVFAVDAFGALPNFYQLLVLIPSIALGVRRLHDTGRSGWWYLLVLTVIGSIVLLVWFCQDSAPDNKYGPSPKGYSAGGYPGYPPTYPTYPTYPQGPQDPPPPQSPQDRYNHSDYNGPELK